jgi:flagellar biogenesis protein FliO
VTRLVASGARPNGRTRCLKLLDRFSVSKDKTIVLISLGQSAYLLGITNQAITLINTVPISDLPEEKQYKAGAEALFSIQANGGDTRFASILNRIRRKAETSKDDSLGDGWGDQDVR